MKSHILLFDKNVARKKSDILFIQIDNDGFTQTDSRKPISGEQLSYAHDLIQKYKRNEQLNCENLKYNMVAKQDILKEKRISLIGRMYRAIRFAEGSRYPPVKLSRQLINIVKGLSPAQSTVEGNYPLIVTAKSNKTADHYSFDTKAICIPLVSSTGHGHASVHRIHYVEGKFALANIMCAITVLNESRIHPKYLFYALSAMKDEVIASLMTGTSNVSLDIEDIYEVEVPLPSIEIQNDFVREQEKLESKIYEMQLEAKRLENIIASESTKIWT